MQLKEPNPRACTSRRERGRNPRRPRSADDHIRIFKVTKRFDEDISAVMMAMRLTIRDGRIVTARVAFGGMAATPKRALSIEKALLESRIQEGSAWAAAAEALGQDFTPLDDHRASAAYRLQVGKNLVVKALAEIAGAPSSATRVIGHREATHAAE